MIPAVAKSLEFNPPLPMLGMQSVKASARRIEYDRIAIDLSRNTMSAPPQRMSAPMYGS